MMECALKVESDCVDTTPTDVDAMAEEITQLRLDVAYYKDRHEQAERNFQALMADSIAVFECYDWIERQISYGARDDGMTWATFEWCVDVSSMAPNSFAEAIADAMTNKTTRGHKGEKV